MAETPATETETETATPPAPPPPPEPQGVIHDLGYQRYLGKRRPQSTRWQVIMRQQVAFGMKRWWRVKLWIGLSVLITVIMGVILIVAKSSAVDPIVYRWSIDSLVKSSFFLAFTAGCGVISSDLRTGAFSFYFVRPVRPVDYIIGKVVGLFILQAIVFMAPLVLLAGVRVGLSHGTSELIDNLAFLPKALLVGALGSLTYASLSLGFSAIFSKNWLNLLFWGLFYIIVATMVSGIGIATDNPDIGVIDPKYALMSLSFGLHHATVPIELKALADTTAAILGLVGLSAIGIAGAYLRVHRAALRGIGGAS